MGLIDKSDPGPTASTLDREQPPLPATPLKACSPRAAKLRPDPATRSTTMRETSTSPAPAAAATRAAVCTAMPLMSSSRSSTSPVCTPARTSRPRPRNTSRITVAHRMAGGSVEPGEGAVAGGLDLTAVEARKLAPDLGIVPAEQVLPSLVAELDRSLRGVDDVGKQHGGQDALDRRRRPDAGKELLDLIEHGIGVARKEQVVVALDLDELGPGDAVGEVATHLDAHHPVVPPVKHESRHLDRGQHFADVQLRIEREDVRDHARAGGHALQPRPPPPEIGVARRLGAHPPIPTPSPQPLALGSTTPTAAPR